MNHIAPQEPARATGKVKALFDGVQAKLGTVPNLFRVLGTAPAALEGCLTDGEIVETVVNVALNILTPYLNHVTRTVVDFPEVAPGVEAEPATATWH